MPEKVYRLLSSLFFIVVVAFVLRLVTVGFLYQGQLNPRSDHLPFGYETGRIARAIVSGRGFSDPLIMESGPTALLTPVYPYLAAGVFKVSGIFTPTSAVILLSLNSLFSALTCVPVFLMARESFGQKVAIWAGWTWALFPYGILLSVDLIWETCLTALLLSLLFLITLRLERSTMLAAWVGFGLLWGAAALTNPAVLSLLPFLVGWACYRLHRRGRPWGIQATAALLALVVVVSPWFVRNYRTFHRLIPFRDGFWLEMHVGNNGDTSLWAPEVAHPTSSVTEAEDFYRMGELNYMIEKRRQATEFIRGHLGWFVWMTVRRIVHMWTGYWSLPASGRFEAPFDPELPFDPTVIALFSTLTILAIAGLWRVFEQRAHIAWPYAFVMLCFPLVYYVTHSDLRYRHPVDPMLVVLATFACVNLLSPERKRSAFYGNSGVQNTLVRMQGDTAKSHAAY
jgi:4-amino-4-deoxy-L-arabinose transferase-like glycosyltransferase